MQKQIMIGGVDTELSLKADKYIEAISQLKAVEVVANSCKKDLIKAMRKVGKKNFTHNGFRIIFRAGHKTDSAVVLKNA